MFKIKNTDIIILLILISLLWILIYSYLYLNKEGFENKPIQIVVSRYNEDLEWLKREDLQFPVIIYNKGDNDNFYKPKNSKVINLPNLGREGETYLHHIVDNYDNLEELTIFLPGSADMKNKIEKLNRIMKSINKEIKTTFPIEKKDNNNFIKDYFYGFKLDNWKSTNNDNSNKNSESNLTISEIRPFGKWYEKTFDKNVKYFSYNGIFSVSKDHIHQYSKEYYENLQKQLLVSSNPEVGHYFERAWVAVFGVTDNANFI